ncbi:hypothetical protein FPV67DRAFT_1473085 [Lyophyllum atratum]|nr:hypothetical protein FPV67DRAFT_1473085 [Lyophyllum atratum]
MKKFGLLECPEDLHLEILAHLDLSDVLTVLRLCSSFRKLGENRVLWISLLERTEARRPIACPRGTDLRKLDMQALRTIARRTDQLEQNWSRQSPRVTGSVKIPMSKRWRQTLMLATIPGTSLIINCASKIDEDVLLLCSFDDRRIRTKIHSMGTLHGYASYDDNGRFLIAITARPSRGFPEDQYLCIFSITYEWCQTPEIQKVYQTSVAEYSDLAWKMFLYKDVLFYMWESLIGRHEIRAFNYNTNKQVVIPLGHDIRWVWADGPPCCTISEGIPVITYAFGKTYGVYRCPIELFPGSTTPTQERLPLHDLECVNEVDSPVLPRPDSLYLYPAAEDAMLFPSPLGYHVFVYGYHMSERSQGLANGTFTVVEFLPAHTSVSARVELQKAYHLMVLSPSGSYALLSTSTVESHKADVDIILLRFISEPADIEVRRIALPSETCSDLRTASVLIDERLGVIYIDDIGTPSSLIAVQFT